MKNLISLVLLTVSASWSFAQSKTGIVFSHDSLPQLLSQAKNENKLIMIDCYTSWCGPCKWLDSNVFNLEEVGKLYNSTFICTKIDMEKGQGVAIAKRYQVQCFPTFLFLDSTGAVIHRTSGAYPAKDFLNIPAQVSKPNECYGYYEKQYNSGSATTRDFIRYVFLRDANCLSYKDMVTAYEDKQPETAMTSRDNWLVFNTLINSVSSRMFQYMTSHRSEFDAKYTADSVDMVIERLYADHLLGMLWQQEPDTAGYSKARKDILAMNTPVSHKIVLQCDMERAYQDNRWGLYGTLAVQYLGENLHGHDHTYLNNVAWAFYEHVEDTAQIEAALIWAQKSVALSPQGFNTDTYAALLFKLGKYKEAKTWAKIAIMLFKEEQEDYAGTEKMLQDIEAKLK